MLPGGEKRSLSGVFSHRKIAQNIIGATERHVLILGHDLIKRRVFLRQRSRRFGRLRQPVFSLCQSNLSRTAVYHKEPFGCQKGPEHSHR